MVEIYSTLDTAAVSIDISYYVLLQYHYEDSDPRRLAS